MPKEKHKKHSKSRAEKEGTPVHQQSAEAAMFALVAVLCACSELARHFVLRILSLLSLSADVAAAETAHPDEEVSTHIAMATYVPPTLRLYGTDLTLS